MRVSERQIFDSGSARLARARAEHADKTQQAATGLRVPTAASDPAAAATLQRQQAARVRADSIAKSTQSAGDDLNAVDGALNEAANVLEQAVSLAVQMSNDTFSAADRRGAATAARAQLASFVAALNVEQDGRFLLGGSKQSAPPFAPDGSYVGDDVVRRAEVAPGEFEDVSVRADVGIKGAGGGVDIPATLQALTDALAANDTSAIRGTIDALHGSIAQLSTLRSDVGAKGTLLLSATSAALSVRDATDAAKADTGDVDITAAASELALAERAFEAATTATARSFKLTLLDSLR